MTIKNMRDPDLFDSKFKHDHIVIVRRGEPIGLSKLEEGGKKFICLEGCHMCCEPICLTKGYWESHKHLAFAVDEVYEVDNLILPMRKNESRCVFLSHEDGCLVYKDRPVVCILYGLDSGFECPYIKPSGEIRRRSDRRIRERAYHKDLKSTMYMRVLTNKRDANLIWKRQ